MKFIDRDQRPIGKYSKHCVFYTEDIIKETEKAFLANIYVSDFSGNENRWIPKSVLLACKHIDKNITIKVGNDWVQNPNYGKDRVQYFVPMKFLKDNVTPTPVNFSKYEDEDDRPSGQEILGVKGINY